MTASNHACHHDMAAPLHRAVHTAGKPEANTHDTLIHAAPYHTPHASSWSPALHRTHPWQSEAWSGGSSRHTRCKPMPLPPGLPALASSCHAASWSGTAALDVRCHSDLVRANDIARMVPNCTAEQRLATQRLAPMPWPAAACCQLRCLLYKPERPHTVMASDSENDAASAPQPIWMIGASPCMAMCSA